jgi:hypothetical protein
VLDAGVSCSKTTPSVFVRHALLCSLCSQAGSCQSSFKLTDEGEDDGKFPPKYDANIARHYREPRNNWKPRRARAPAYQGENIIPEVSSSPVASLEAISHYRPPRTYLTLNPRLETVTGRLVSRGQRIFLCLPGESRRLKPLQEIILQDCCSSLNKLTYSFR